MSVKAAIWVRVSTDRQHEDNQIPDLERLCEHRGWEITRRYEIAEGEHRQALGRMLDDAHRGEFSVLVVWAVDRLCRQGIEELLRLIRELRERNVSLVSHQEPWLNGTDATTDLLAAVAAWVATQESVRRSERIRAGLARRRAQGKPIGGAASKRGKDKRPRRTEGYKQAWARRKSAPLGAAILVIHGPVPRTGAPISCSDIHRHDPRSSNTRSA
jgi:DNA invertase Pin-like site-specific DNA recombinase